jgi:protein-disulfide isomerase
VSTRVKEKKAAAKVVREQLAREKRRRRALLTSGVVVLVLVVAGMIGWGLLGSQQGGTGPTPPSAVADGTGFADGTGPVTVDVYADLMCPNCRTFETQTGPTLDRLVADRKATVVYHPISILDNASSTQYSTRAAAATAAAADGGKFLAYFEALYAQQPAEGGAGLSNDKLVEIGRSVGLGDDFATKVQDGTYRAWVGRATEAAAKKGVNGTPTVFVAGKELKDRSPAGITAAVDAG